MMDNYINILEDIKLFETDASATQLGSASLRSVSLLIANDNPNNWIESNLQIYNSKPNKKLVLYILISIVLGGMIGAIYVLISNASLKRKSRHKKA